MTSILFRVGGLMAAIALSGVVIASAQTAPGKKPAAPASGQPAAAPHPAPSAPASVTPAPAAPLAPSAPPAPPAPPAPETYTYNSEGRRDPFVSLVARGAEPAMGKRSDGLGGLSATDIMVRGVLLSRGAYIALVSGPEGRTYTAHVNDRLVDGTIRTITPQGLVIMQEVNDPLSLIKQREVRKGLRTSEDGK